MVGVVGEEHCVVSKWEKPVFTLANVGDLLGYCKPVKPESLTMFRVNRSSSVSI